MKWKLGVSRAVYWITLADEAFRLLEREVLHVELSLGFKKNVYICINQT